MIVSKSEFKAHPLTTTHTAFSSKGRSTCSRTMNPLRVDQSWWPKLSHSNGCRCCFIFLIILKHPKILCRYSDFLIIIFKTERSENNKACVHSYQKLIAGYSPWYRVLPSCHEVSVTHLHWLL